MLQGTGSDSVTFAAAARGYAAQFMQFSQVSLSSFTILLTAAHTKCSPAILLGSLRLTNSTDHSDDPCQQLLHKVYLLHIAIQPVHTGWMSNTHCEATTVF